MLGLHCAVQIDFLGESTGGDLLLVQSLRKAGMVTVFRLKTLDDMYIIPLDKVRQSTQVRCPHGWPQRAGVCWGAVWVGTDLGEPLRVSRVQCLAERAEGGG